MEVLSLKGKLPFEIIDSITSRGIESFTPPQEQAIAKGLLNFKNIVVASPTASGKTLVAEIGCANAIISKRKKAVYIAPMRALVDEKYNEFKKAYPYLKTAMSIGDLDSNDLWLKNYDALFVSTEKFDSLIRHGIDWVQQIGCIVFDEVHMIDDSSRGPTLEILITKLRSITDAQIIALSATIGNANEIAKWLNAELVTSEYRPVKLKKGIVNEGTAYCADPDSDDVLEEKLYGTAPVAEVRVVEDTTERKKQALIFYSTKRNAEAGAVRLSTHIHKLLAHDEREKLEILGDKIQNVLERPTEQCMKLGGLIKKGVSFHHAGLINAQRNMIEEAFRSGLIKAICSTSTLGLGINMPAHTVLVRDITRFEDGGSEMMGVNEVMQLFGRAGRPKYDTEGRAFLIGSTKERVSELFRSYITASPEPVYSNLGIIPVLRTHILAFIAENFLTNKSAMQAFMLRTFYGQQYGNTRHIKNLIDEIIDELVSFEFIREENDGNYSATKIGKRVSELYIDPISAKWIINSLERKNDVIGLLFMLTNTIEMRPYVKATLEAEEEFAAHRHIYGEKSIFKEYDRMDYGYYDPVKAFSTALMLRDWIEENREQDIIKKYNSTPGALFGKLSNADWMVYSATELAKLTKKPLHDLIDLRVRMRYGIKEELLDLTRLQQVGRVRARLLYNSGIKKVSDIRNNKALATKLLGQEIANKIFAQLV